MNKKKKTPEATRDHSENTITHLNYGKRAYASDIFWKDVKFQFLKEKFVDRHFLTIEYFFLITSRWI